MIEVIPFVDVLLLQGGKMESLPGMVSGPVIPTAAWDARKAFLQQTCIAWSPVCYCSALTPAAAAAGDSDGGGSTGGTNSSSSDIVSLLVVGTRSGHVVVWRQQLPGSYQPQEGQLPGDSWSCLGVTRVTGSQVTSLAWCVVPGAAGDAAKAVLAGVAHDGDHLVLATGGYDA